MESWVVGKDPFAFGIPSNTIQHIWSLSTSCFRFCGSTSYWQSSCGKTGSQSSACLTHQSLQEFQDWIHCRHVTLSVQNALEHKPAGHWTWCLVNPGQAVRAIDVRPQFIAWSINHGCAMNESDAWNLRAYHLQFVDHFNKLSIIRHTHLSLGWSKVRAARPRNANVAWSSSALENSYTATRIMLDHSCCWVSRFLMLKSSASRNIMSWPLSWVAKVAAQVFPVKCSNEWCIQEAVTISCSPSNSILGSGLIYTNRCVQTLNISTRLLDHKCVGLCGYIRKPWIRSRNLKPCMQKPNWLTLIDQKREYFETLLACKLLEKHQVPIFYLLDFDFWITFRRLNRIKIWKDQNKSFYGVARKPMVSRQVGCGSGLPSGSWFLC